MNPPGHGTLINAHLVVPRLRPARHRTACTSRWTSDVEHAAWPVEGPTHGTCVALNCARSPENVLQELRFQLVEAPSF